MLHAVGTAFADVVAVVLIALILAYPSGRLETRLDRVTVAILAIGTTANNAIRLVPMPPDVDLELGRLYVGVALASFGGLVVIRRWVVAPRGRRAELLPVLIAGSVLMGVLVTSLVIQFFDVPPRCSRHSSWRHEVSHQPRSRSPCWSDFYRQSELRQQRARRRPA